MIDQLYDKFVCEEYPCEDEFYLCYQSRYQELWEQCKAADGTIPFRDVLHLVDNLECMMYSERKHYFRVGYLMGKQITEELAGINGCD